MNELRSSILIHTVFAPLNNESSAVEVSGLECLEGGARLRRRNELHERETSVPAREPEALGEANALRLLGVRVSVRVSVSVRVAIRG